MGKTDKIKKAQKIEELEEIDELLIETDNFATTTQTCEDAWLNRNMNAVVGETGLGKTTALISHLRNHPECTYYVKVTKSMNVKLFYSSIYSSTGLMDFDTQMPIYYVIRKASNFFCQDSTNKLLIIDEAGKFTPPMLEFLHELRDLTKRSLGIILAGPEYFQTRIEEWEKNGIPGVPELYSRINYWQKLEEPLFKEVKAFIRKHDINDIEFENENKGVQNFRVLKFRVLRYLEMKKRKDTKNNKNGKSI